MKSRIRIVIADDHPIFRQGLRQVLEGDPDMPRRLLQQHLWRDILHACPGWLLRQRHGSQLGNAVPGRLFQQRARRDLLHSGAGWLLREHRGRHRGNSLLGRDFQQHGRCDLLHACSGWLFR